MRSSKSPSNGVDWDTAYLEKVVPPEQLVEWANEIRAQRKTIATLNGSFDLLHAGHLHILFEASKQADVLLVALNTDASIKGYKGPKRPLISLENRLKMICALSFVTAATYFDEPHPIPLLKTVRPDVHVNGSEYGENCIEAPYVAKLHIVPLKPGLSTSSLIEKIQCG